MSVSLGLIVTELVINSSNTPFPNRGAANIVVGYGAMARTGRCSIRDDGIGIPTDVR